MYSYRATHGPAGHQVEIAFTDRHGGVSAAPFDSLNLAIEGDDDPVAVADNLRRVLDDFAPGDRLADVRQVHGADVVIGDPPDTDRHSRPEGDALVADRVGVVLAVRAADCVPVLLADAVAGVIGAAHAGRKGLAAGVVLRAVERMRELGAGDVTAWIGPHVCGSCYEVPERMRAEVAADLPAAWATTSWGTPALDLGAGVRTQLEEAGVDVVDVARCTVESDDLYSYRRDGRAAGRMAGLVRRVPAGGSS